MVVSKKKIALYSFGVLVLVFFIVLGVVYHQFSDLEKFKKMAVERLEDLTGKKVSIGSAEMDFIKGLSVKLKEVTIGGNYEEKPKFHANSLWMVIKLLPLLDKRIEVKKIEVEGVFLQLIRDVKGGLNVERLQYLVSQPASEDGFLEALKGSLVNKLEIKGGEIRFIDLKTFAGDSKPAILQIKEVHVLIQKKLLQIPFDFLIQGKIPNPGHPTKIKVAGTFDNPTMTWDLAGFSIDGQIEVEDLPVAWLHPYYKKVVPSVPGEGRITLDSKLSGSLGGNLQSTGKLKFIAQQEISGPVLRDPSVPHRGTLDYEILYNKDTIRFTKIKMDSPSFNFTAKGALGQYSSQDPAISFDIKTGEFQINKSESYLPLQVLPKEYHQQVHQRFKNGTIEFESFKFQGTLSQLQNLSLKENHRLLSGKVRMRQVDWLAPLPRLQNVSGSLQLESGNSALNIKKARFQNHPIINVKGTIKDLLYKPVADLSLENKVEIGRFHQTLMKGLEGHSFQDFVSIYRDMKGPGRVRIHLKGPLMDPDKISLTGAIFLDGVSLYQEGIGPRIKNLNGKIDYNLVPSGSAKGKKSEIPLLKFDNFSGRFGKSTFWNVFGKVVLKDGVPTKEMAGKYELDVQELPQVITDLALEYPFDVLHENAKYTSGSVQVDYRSLGNAMNLEEIEEWGEIQLKDLSLRYEKGFLPISNLSGKISFGDHPLHLVDVKGWYGNSPIYLEGDLTPYTPNGPEFALMGKSSKFLPTSLKDIPFLEKLKYTGYLETEFTIKGTLHDLEFDNTIDFSQASYQYKDLFIKPTSAFNKLQFKGHFDSKKGMIIKDLTYNLGVNKITGKANLDSFDTPEFEIHLNSKNFRTNVLAASLKPFKNNHNGLADFQIKGQGNFNKLADAKFGGQVVLTNLEFLPKDHAHLITLNSEIKFSEKTVLFESGSLASDKSGVLFDGIFEWGDRPTVDLKISGKRLVLEELLPAKTADGGDLGKYLNESPLFSKGSSRISFELDELGYKLLTLKTVAGAVSVEKKKFKINKLEIGKDSRLRGRGMFELEGDESLRFKGLIQAEQIPAQDFFALFGDTFRNGMTGQLKTLDVRVKGQGKGLQEIGKSLMVKSSFDFRSGQIDHERLKVGTLRLFGFQEEIDEQNESSLKDNFSKYEQIAGNFMLVNGIGETENFIYENDKRRSSLVGTFDLNKYEMDTVLGVAPMAALDKILTKIPVFGKIITGGDEESLVKTYFTVKGKFDKPEIKSIPFTSLTKKVVGIFQGILQTPEFILNPAGEETN
ncbi:MAG: hypothetical protein NPINA01_00330 [Nitrospinaceae bacterium]|nr:MAG: hypothetical protein NPINA01_00330 [Nitrospinaceae bacterium]